MSEIMNALNNEGSGVNNLAGMLASIDRRIEEAKQHPTPTQYDCPYCEDLGMEHFYDQNGVSMWRPCRCRRAKIAEARMKRSGLGEALKKYTFDTFTTGDPMQKTMKDTALRYVDALLHPEEGCRPWLFICGNPGNGKTHICTAVCGELLRNDKAVLYMKWTLEARQLKARMNDPELDEILEPYLTCEVLYIDDLMKDRYGRFDPSDADIRLAFTILNERYLRDLPTIITCEWDLIRDLMSADVGLFSRVYERSKGFIVRIARDGKNNYRLKELYNANAELIECRMKNAERRMYPIQN